MVKNSHNHEEEEKKVKNMKHVKFGEEEVDSSSSAANNTNAPAASMMGRLVSTSRKTLVVIKSHGEEGIIAGGYTTTAWDGKQSYVNQCNNINDYWLFSFKSPNNSNNNKHDQGGEGEEEVMVTKYLCRNGCVYQSCDPDYGPIFGVHPSGGGEKNTAATSTSSSYNIIPQAIATVTSSMMNSHEKELRLMNEGLNKLGKFLHLDHDDDNEGAAVLVVEEEKSKSISKEEEEEKKKMEKKKEKMESETAYNASSQPAFSNTLSRSQATFSSLSQHGGRKFHDLCISATMTSPTNSSVLSSYSLIAPGFDGGGGGGGGDQLGIKGLFGSKHFAVAEIEVFEVLC
jgi:hypothetical protein